MAVAANAWDSLEADWDDLRVDWDDLRSVPVIIYQYRHRQKSKG